MKSCALAKRGYTSKRRRDGKVQSLAIVVALPTGDEQPVRGRRGGGGKEESLLRGSGIYGC